MRGLLCSPPPDAPLPFPLPALPARLRVLHLRHTGNLPGPPDGRARLVRRLTLDDLPAGHAGLGWVTEAFPGLRELRLGYHPAPARSPSPRWPR